MKNLFLWCLSIVCLNSFPAVAEDEFDDFGGFETTGDDLFTDKQSTDDDSANQSSKKVLSAFISSRIPATSAKNIENAEKVFCYTVEYATADFSGYTIDDLAITGSCGELSDEGRTLMKDTILGNSSFFSTSVDNCNISPRIMLRYVYGVDSTDVLLSAPCHSLTFFHGRNVSTINAAPGKNILEQIINTYSSLSEKFLSPALLGQVVPNGQIVTQNQKEIVRKLKVSDSPKKWQTESNGGTATRTESAQPAKKGWNKLK